MLVWSIDLIDDTNRSGSMEFVVPATDADSFYPVEVRGGMGVLLRFQLDCRHCSHGR